MNYEREAWYKLYLRESTEDRLLPVLNRALRDFLLRLAKSRDDPTILRVTKDPGRDIAMACGAHENEIQIVDQHVRSMIRDGYLTHRRGRLWITNFVAAQKVKSEGAVRQERWRKGKRGARSVSRDVTRDVTGDVSGDVTRDATETLARRLSGEETRRDEKRRDAADGVPAAAHQPAAGSRHDAAATAAAAAEDSNGESESDETSRETACPFDLLDRPGVRNMLAELAEKLPAPIGALETEAREFVSYWTIGEGKFRRRTGWVRRLRERLRKRHFAGELGSAAQSKPNADWPTDQAIRLREAIRSGRWGTRLKTKEASGQLDFALALRLIREGEVERHEFAEAKAADPETADRLASLTSGLFRRLT